MSDYMNEGYYESLATQEKMKSHGTNEEIIAQAMKSLGLTKVPSYFMPQQGAFLPDLGAFRAFTLLTEGKESLLRNVLCRSRCTVEVGRQEIEDIVGEEAMKHLDESQSHQGEIDVVHALQQLRSDEVSALYSVWRRSAASEDKGVYDRAASLHGQACLEEHHTSSRSVMLRDEAFKKMLEVMK